MASIDPGSRLVAPWATGGDKPPPYWLSEVLVLSGGPKSTPTAGTEPRHYVALNLLTTHDSFRDGDGAEHDVADGGEDEALDGGSRADGPVRVAEEDVDRVLDDQLL